MVVECCKDIYRSNELDDRFIDRWIDFITIKYADMSNINDVVNRHHRKFTVFGQSIISY